MINHVAAHAKLDTHLGRNLIAAVGHEAAWTKKVRIAMLTIAVFAALC